MVTDYVIDWLKQRPAGQPWALCLGHKAPHGGPITPDAGSDSGPVPDAGPRPDGGPALDGGTDASAPDAGPPCPGPGIEVCNGRDDDCDSSIDESSCASCAPVG